MLSRTFQKLLTAKLAKKIREGRKENLVWDLRSYRIVNKTDRLRGEKGREVIWPSK
jgi:hypothetical protein